MLSNQSKNVLLSKYQFFDLLLTISWFFRMREQKRKRDEEKKSKMNYLTGGTN